MKHVHDHRHGIHTTQGRASQPQLQVPGFGHQFSDGIWNAVNEYAGRPLAFWFVLFGFMSILFGAAVDQIEKDQQEFSSFLRYGFSSLTLLAIVAMPVSGGWLMVPAAIGLLLRKARMAEQIDP